AREPTLGVVRLRWRVSQGAGPERIGRGLIIEHGPSPSAAISEPVTVLHHEVHVMLGARHGRIREVLVLFRVPMDLRHLGAVGERLAVAGNAGQTGVDHHGVSEDHSDQLVVLTDGNNLPAFISPELREREPTWYSHGVLVLLGKGYAAQ